MKILFLHGWHSVPGGVEPTYLKDQGHEVINPALDDDDFDAALSTAQAECDKHQPQVVVGLSRRGAVAMNISSGDAKLVLLCPAWKNWGTAKTVRPDAVILHSRADDVIPFSDSEELAKNSGAALIEIGNDHRLADPEPLEVMLSVVEGTARNTKGMTTRNSTVGNAETRRISVILPGDGDAFISVVQKQTVPWIEQSTVPFFHLRKNPQTNEYENGIIDKDRSGVLLKIGDDHFLLTAAHNIPDMVRDKIFLCMSWDEDEHAPIPITTDQIAVSDEKTLDVAAIKLLPETAEKLLRRHIPLCLADIAIDCRSSDGLFLIVGYPRAGTEFFEQKWNDPHPHEIKTESLKYVCKRMLDGWKHDKLEYSAEMHIVVGMSANSVSGTTGQPEVLPDHGGIQGISGCGIWFIADRNRRLPLSAFGVSDCKLVAIEHSYDEAAGRVAGTWIDVALAFLSLNFPETRPAMELIYPQSPAI